MLTRSPSIIQAWAANLPVGPSYAQQLLADLSGVLEQAVADSLIPRNPVRAARIRAPRVVRSKIVPWTAGQVDAIRGELPSRYKAMTDTGRYLGLRQGEIFGLSLDEIDWLHRVVHVGHQVKLFKSVTPVSGPPKGGKPRDVPLPHQAAEALAAHLERVPRPRSHCRSNHRTAGRGRSRSSSPGIRAARATGQRSTRRSGCLRGGGPGYRTGPRTRAAPGCISSGTIFASLLLRGGVDIKRVQEWLGHHSAAFTLDIYGHLMPDDHEASLRQVEAIFAAALRSAPDGPETARPGAEGR